MDSTAMNDWLADFIYRSREFIELHAPEMMPGADWVGLILVAAGLLVGIFGAPYAKGLLSAVLGGLGYALGTIAAGVYEYNEVVGGLVGLLLLSTLAYYTHRLWVGVAVGLLASSLGLFAYGHDSVLPAFLQYEPNKAVVDGENFSYNLPTVTEQQANLNPNILGYAKDFYEHLKGSQPQVTQNATLLSGLCLIGGFAIGVWCTRWALILSSAVLGTILFNSGLASFAEAFAPGGWTNRLSQHPNGTLGFVAACFCLSLLVQFRLTQQTTPPATSEKPTS